MFLKDLVLGASSDSTISSDSKITEGGEIVACSVGYRGRQRLTGEILRDWEPCPE